MKVKLSAVLLGALAVQISGCSLLFREPLITGVVLLDNNVPAVVYDSSALHPRCVDGFVTAHLGIGKISEDGEYEALGGDVTETIQNTGVVWRVPCGVCFLRFDRLPPGGVVVSEAPQFAKRLNELANGASKDLTFSGVLVDDNGWIFAGARGYSTWLEADVVVDPKSHREQERPLAEMFDGDLETGECDS